MDLKRVGILIGTAAGVVGGVLALFGGVLQRLVPPTSDMSPIQSVGVASLASLLLLLIVVLVLPARPSVRQRRWIAAFGAVVGLAAVLLLFNHIWRMNSYVFEYPLPAEGKPERHVRGEWTPMGQAMAADMSIAEAVKKVGGVQNAEENLLLWTEESRKQVELRLLASYVASVSLFSLALFSVTIAVISARRAD
jgi:hypothetical protein